MADRTEIAWCDSTFNPWIGCTKVGPGCDHCYAERDMDQRRHRVKWGAGQARSRTSADYWKQPLRWNRATFNQCAVCGWRGDGVGASLEVLGCPGCRGFTFLAARRRVFCASLADVFDNEVDPQWRADLFGLIARTPNLDWLLLTKRIGNAASLGEAAVATARSDSANSWELPAWPWPNVWLGATVVNQAEAERDLQKLLNTRAAVHFVSIEPMVGSVRPDRLYVRDTDYGNAKDYFNALTGEVVRAYRNSEGEDTLEFHRSPLPGLDWVIAGGESGPGARPMHPDWVRDLRDACNRDRVPFLFKQWGEWAPQGDDDRIDKHPFGMFAGTSFFPDKVVIGGSAPMHRRGKKAAGRQLDGALHNAFPKVPA